MQISTQDWVVYFVGEASNAASDRIASYSLLREEATHLARMTSGHRHSFWRARRAGLVEYVDHAGDTSEAVTPRFRLTASGWASFADVEEGCKAVLGTTD